MFKEYSWSGTLQAMQEKVQSITIVGSNSELFLLLQNQKVKSKHSLWEEIKASVSTEL